MAVCTYLHYEVIDSFVAETKACEQAIIFSEELGSIIQDIKAKIGSFESITFLLVGRQANVVAHALARESRRFSNPRYRIEEALSIGLHRVRRI
ncbi:hypothetical protein Golax_014504, partial [Gossypium laxum]|nr:hypothetical protein [Gossypium laxum]